MKVMILLLFLPITVNAKVVQLTYHFMYSNISAKDSGAIYHRVTIPLSTINQQLIHIDTSGLPFKIKNHKHSLDAQYVEVFFNVPAKSKVSKTVVFTLNIDDYVFALADTQLLTEKELDDFHLLKYVKPSRYIESEAKQIKAIAKSLVKKNQSFEDKIKSNYEFVNDYLSYKILAGRTSALASLQSGYGDCTEYSDLFVAISRAMNIPARTAALFNFKNKKIFNQPNHNEAIIFLKKYGWVVVYTNLGLGKYDNPYAIGNVTADNIVYKAENVWVWSNYFTNKRIPKDAIKLKVQWKIQEENN